MDNWDKLKYVSRSWNQELDKIQDHWQFKKTIYHQTETQKVIVHYVGSSDKIVRAPHGNSLDKDVVFMTTNPVVVKKVKDIGLAAKPAAVRNTLNLTLPAGTLASTNACRDTSSVKY